MKLVLHPNPLLTQVCKAVEKFDDDLMTIVDQMLDVMYSSDGVGLAAPQVGLSIDLLLVDPTGGNTRDGLIVMANPQLTFPRLESVKMDEGCLSIPGTYLTVERPVVVNVVYQNVKGQTLSSTFGGGWTSRIIQHEYDHLRGVLMLDRAASTSQKKTSRHRSQGVSGR